MHSFISIIALMFFFHYIQLMQPLYMMGQSTVRIIFLVISGMNTYFQMLFYCIVGQILETQVSRNIKFTRWWNSSLLTNVKCKVRRIKGRGEFDSGHDKSPIASSHNCREIISNDLVDVLQRKYFSFLFFWSILSCFYF